MQTEGMMNNLKSSLLGLPRGLNSPKQSIERLVNIFIPYSSEVKKNNIYHIRNDLNGFFILLGGRVDVCHTRSGMTLSTVNAPYILGISIVHGIHWEGYLRANKNAKLKFVNLEEVPPFLFEDKSIIWKDISIVLSFHLQYAGYRDSVFGLRNSYSIIKAKLTEVAEMPSEIRKDIPIISYIVNSTSLSRSMVSRTLKDLKAGSYIEMNAGVLIKINHLPNRY